MCTSVLVSACHVWINCFHSKPMKQQCSLLLVLDNYKKHGWVRLRCTSENRASALFLCRDHLRLLQFDQVFAAQQVLPLHMPGSVAPTCCAPPYALTTPSSFNLLISSRALASASGSELHCFHDEMSAMFQMSLAVDWYDMEGTCTHQYSVKF